MAKFCGNVGYATTKEIEPGLYEEEITERLYYGDVIRDNRRVVSSSDVNASIDISNQISIITDPFANENFFAMRYVVYMGIKWKITNVEVQYPRLILSLGGVYNERTSTSSE